MTNFHCLLKTKVRKPDIETRKGKVGEDNKRSQNAMKVKENPNKKHKKQ